MAISNLGHSFSDPVLGFTDSGGELQDGYSGRAKAIENPQLDIHLLILLINISKFQTFHIGSLVHSTVFYFWAYHLPHWLRCNPF